MYNYFLVDKLHISLKKSDDINPLRIFIPLRTFDEEKEMDEIDES